MESSLSVSDDVVPEHVRRAVRYLAMLQANGAEPTVHELDAFAVEPQPREIVDLIPSWSFRYTRIQPVTNYLFALKWIVRGGRGVRLTRLGAAMATAFGGKAAVIDRKPDTTVLDLTDAILEPGDPDAFEQFARIVASLDGATLCDPYFKATSISWVLRGTRISRVLISKKGATKERAPIAARLAAGDVAGRLEVRVSNADEIHDRALIAASGDVWIMGTSVNGVGRHLSSLIRPDQECWPIYRRRVEGWWKEATPIEPLPLTDAAVG